jgi:putative ABC transport system substrate-binding protein
MKFLLGSRRRGARLKFDYSVCLIRPIVPCAMAGAKKNQTASTDIFPRTRPSLLQSQVLNASSSDEIDATFGALVREPADALFVAPDAFFISRRVQFATLTARDRIPAAYADREIVEAGGLMSYGTDFTDMFRRVGVYTGRILKGEKRSDLPVQQATKVELIVNL